LVLWKQPFPNQRRIKEGNKWETEEKIG